MATPSDFLRFVLPYVPTAAEIAATRYLVDSAIDFCMQTGIWREQLEPLSVRAGQAQVELELPIDSQLHEIKQVYFKGQKVEPMAPDQVWQLGEDWEGKTGSLPKKFITTVPNLMRLYPVPEATEKKALSVFVSLAPSRNAATLPDILLDRYPNAIAYGALYRLLMEPHQIYSNPQQAGEFFKMCEAAKPLARKEAQEGFNRARFRTRAHYY